jgi:hypothetical protein
MAKDKSEFASITRLLVVAEARRWTDETTGQELLHYFNTLVEKAKSTQGGICDICRGPIEDSANVATRQDYIVHLTCREWPRTWLRVRSNPQLRRIQRSVKAFNART